MSRASVVVGSRVCAAIEKGLLIYLGVGHDDGDADINYLVDKIRHLRIFPDESDRMNLDVSQGAGSALVVSAFTVQADARRGRRPTLEAAAPPERAFVLYQMFCEALAKSGIPTSHGAFGEFMLVDAVNAGPICILLESRRAF